MILNTFKIDILLAERGMTKTELARRCGITRQNISTYLSRGTCEPRTVGKLATGLGVEVAEIVKASDTA